LKLSASWNLYWRKPSLNCKWLNYHSQQSLPETKTHEHSIVCSSQKSSFSQCSTRYMGKMRYLLLHQEQEIFSILHSTQPHFSMQMRALFPGAKWQGSTVGCSHPWSAEVKDMWSYISTPHTASYGGAQLSTDSHTIHIIKFLHLQNYPRLVCDALITIFHHKIHTLFPLKITLLHVLCTFRKLLCHGKYHSTWPVCVCGTLGRPCTGWHYNEIIYLSFT
jgi:hypothetical protein